MKLIIYACPACTEQNVLSGLGINISMFILLLFAHCMSKMDTSNAGLPIITDVCATTAAHIYIHDTK